MRGYIRAFRALVLPQSVIAVAAGLLLLNSLNPQASLPAVALSEVQGIIVPNQNHFTVPTIPGFSHVAAAAIPAGGSSSAPTLQSAAALSSFRPHVNCDAMKCIALSFDDGPNNVTTPKILDVLEQRHVAASFFVIGRNVSSNEDLVRRMAADGLEIGNHTWDHQDMTKLSPDQIRDELLRTQTAVAATGAPVPKLFRPPYGAIDPAVVASTGMQTALWNEDPRDWQATDPAALLQAIVSTAKPGGVVDLHDIHEVTLAALPSVIDQLQQQGFTFVTISDLLHSRTRAGAAPFYGYDASSYAAKP